MVGIINSFNRTFSYALVSAAVEAGRLTSVPIYSQTPFLLFGMGLVFTFKWSPAKSLLCIILMKIR